MSNISQIRQNFHVESESAINEQINMELSSQYIYQSMSNYFNREDISLPGFSKFYNKCSEEEREHAKKLMKYLNKRGGRVVLQDINKPESEEWGNGLNSLQVALDFEKKVNDSLLALHRLASSNLDSHLTDYLEEEFLDEQVRSIKRLGDMITGLKRAGASSLGEYLFDKYLNDYLID